MAIRYGHVNRRAPWADMWREQPTYVKQELEMLEAASPRSFKTWTKEEDDFVVANCLEMSNRELGLRVGRTAGAVSTRLSFLALMRSDVPSYSERTGRKYAGAPVRRRWTEEEDEFMLKNLDTMTHAELACELDRTIKSVSGRIARLRSLQGEEVGE